MLELNDEMINLLVEKISDKMKVIVEEKIEETMKTLSSTIEDSIEDTIEDEVDHAVGNAVDDAIEDYLDTSIRNALRTIISGNKIECSDGTTITFRDPLLIKYDDGRSISATYGSFDIKHEVATGNYKLYATHNGWPNYILLAKYSTLEEAKNALRKIETAILNNETFLEL